MSSRLFYILSRRMRVDLRGKGLEPIGEIFDSARTAKVRAKHEAATNPEVDGVYLNQHRDSRRGMRVVAKFYPRRAA